MGDLRSRIEVAKLARELEVAEDELSYLTHSAPAELRELRRVTSEALFSRHEARAKALASASGILPTAVAAKISEKALGPGLSARVAGVMEPAEAAKMAGHLSPAFLLDLAIRLDPARVGPIVARLPRDVVLDVAHRLLAADELITLARFVAIVDTDVVVDVAERATGRQLLEVALYTEDDAALDAVSEGLPDATLAAMIDAASDGEERAAALELVSRLSAEKSERVLALVDVPMQD